MLQGVTRQAQKCRSTGTPNFLQGVIEETQKCHCRIAPASFIWCRDHLAEMPLLKRTKGRAAPWPQQCHMRLALPTIYRGSLCLRRNAITSPPSTGAAIHAQQCRVQPAPASFIWCRDIIAAMLIQKRTKGRATLPAQQCYASNALPNQFNGVIEKTQKCRDIVAPRGEPSNYRRDASMVALSPTSYRGH